MVGFEVFVLSVPPYLSSTPGGGLEYTSVRGTAPFLSLAFQPPRLLYGRAANYGSFIVLSEGMIFSFQGTLYSSGLLPVWDVALAVTIVYLKIEHILRTRYVLF